MYTGVISGIILIISLSIITSSRIPQQNYYDSILLKCPEVAKVPGYKDQKWLTICKPINVLQNVSALSPETLFDVLCLMYYNSVTHVCKQSTLSNDTLLAQKSDLKVEDICKNFSAIAELTNELISPEECSNKCNVFNETKEICILSYKLVQTKQGIKKEITKDVIQSNTKLEKPVKINKTEVFKTQLPSVINKTKVSESNHPSDSNRLQPSTTVKVKENPPATANVSPKVEAVFKQEITELPQPDSQAIKESVKPKAQPQTIDSQPAAAVLISGVNEHNYKVSNSNEQEAQKSSTNTPTSYVTPLDNLDEPDPNNLQFMPPEDELENESPEEEKKLAVKSKNVEGSNISSEDLDGDSYFFSYFMVICLMVVLGYVAYHNRQKLFALMIEGKRNKRQNRGRRPNSANYHKLDSNLEEAITSDCSKSTSHIIY